ncbi:MAG: hypothetical protein Q4C70_03480 [Planctomycetia bacterium]|nr:hypothetical protein [Planctomycetia bacterium]
MKSFFFVSRRFAVTNVQDTVITYTGQLPYLASVYVTGICEHNVNVSGICNHEVYIYSN